MLKNNPTLQNTIDEVRRVHTTLRVIKQLLKEGNPTQAYVEVSKSLEEAPHAFR